MIRQLQLDTWRTAALFPDRDERVLFHELGHFAVGHALGHVPESITITPVVGERRLNGRVTWKPRTADQPFDFDYRFNRIKIIAGGPAAERLFAAEDRGLRGSDEANARRHARAICGTDRGADHIIRAATAEAEHVLVERASLVMALAETLRASGTLNADQIAEAVAGFEAAKMASSWRQTGRLGGDTLDDVRLRMRLRQAQIERYSAD
jgi:hypothetical protein